MSKKHLLLAFTCFISLLSQSQNKTLLSTTNEPVSFATISFGNGNGLFADDEGKFHFTKKLYSDIDSLFISALGYKDLKLATATLKDTFFLESKADLLDEVIVIARPTGKYKEVTLKPTDHNDYYKCWLPTIESEIAVFFPNEDNKPKHLTKILLPIKTEAKDWKKRSKSKQAKRRFSTLFRVQFYENKNGFPGAVLTYEKVVFIATENTKPIFEFDVSGFDIFVPKDGIYVSIQVLGFTDKNGKLLPNKKYKEVKTRRGIVKVSTTFRPLLPFTDQIETKTTYVKRVFHNNGQWVLFDKQNITNSNLLNAGLNNYGMGLKMAVYKEQ
ncbi:carboxypeptidase-like regulatory domain-containing protein [Olleya sp. HaHaR_3_96]|uniref:carboxypeptidase-like regulatory domain-containing protein n=1 Tax=Olleya sp. HaHaR_3_96 TaxID=2745560 RepID=UPI001C4F03AB|nr:carboxypeptidase-like regulatory domain-containing protein [Olleya sp. HaHaR_3_96]QXP61522.1 hypothetical protein H0I26_07800 [Olleya sp. HaHaR_3_96]